MTRSVGGGRGAIRADVCIIGSMSRAPQARAWRRRFRRLGTHVFLIPWLPAAPAQLRDPARSRFLREGGSHLPGFRSGAVVLWAARDSQRLPAPSLPASLLGSWVLPTVHPEPHSTHCELRRQSVCLTGEKKKKKVGRKWVFSAL